MHFTSPRSIQLFRAVCGVTAILAVPAFNSVFVAARQAQASDVWGSNWGLLAILVAGLGVATLFLAGMTWTSFWERFSAWLGVIDRMPDLMTFSLLAVALVVFPALMMFPASGQLLGTAWLRWYLFWWVCLVAGVLIKAGFKTLDWLPALGLAFALVAAVARVAAYFPAVTAYPLSIGWSEASRYYDASLFFGERIYGQAVTPAVLHPSLHLLLAVPFLAGEMPLWAHRFWMVFLTLGLAATTSLLLSRFFAPKPKVVFILFTLWAFLFLMQGPIYLHLNIPVIIVLLGYDAKNTRKTLIAVVLASLWAGISRINWFPVPAMLAAVLYLIETPLAGRAWLSYLSKPILWFVLGVSAAFASQAAYALLAVGSLREFYSSTSSDLLWNRLLPNPTFPLGVLPGALLVSLPMWGILAWTVVSHRQAFHPLRLLGLGAALAVLFAGGLVVSVKIGGGGDLHNLDAYLVMLLFVTPAVVFGRLVCEPGSQATARLLPWQLAALALLMPAWFAAQELAPWLPRDYDSARAAVEIIRARAEETASQGGEVLFISERHLLALGQVKNIPLVEDYERDFLAEMVMSHNEDYLNRFYDDLKNHRFALIVAETQGYYLREHTSFGEESNLWVRTISQQLLCEYRQTVLPAGVSLFVPRPAPTGCKFP